MPERTVVIDGKTIDPDEMEWRPVRRRPMVVRAVRMDKPFTVQTLEGEMRGDPGDFLIQGVAGEYYPIKPALFSQNYDADVY